MSRPRRGVMLACSALGLALGSLGTACGGGGSGGSGPAPVSPAAAPARPAGVTAACRQAYAEYERSWGIARTQDLAEPPHSFRPDAIAEIVSAEVETLPARAELQTLRLMYGLLEVFVPEAPWVVAFVASEQAIEACGERARKPAAS